MVFVVFLLEFRAVPTVWYSVSIFCFSIRVWSCSDSVVFVVFLLEFGAVPTVWYFLFFY